MRTPEIDTLLTCLWSAHFKVRAQRDGGSPSAMPNPDMLRVELRRHADSHVAAAKAARTQVHATNCLAEAARAEGWLERVGA